MTAETYRVISVLSRRSSSAATAIDATENVAALERSDNVANRGHAFAVLKRGYTRRQSSGRKVRCTALPSRPELSPYGGPPWSARTTAGSVAMLITPFTTNWMPMQKIRNPMIFVSALMPLAPINCTMRPARLSVR